MVSVRKEMRIQKAALDSLLLDNVCEIRFPRRIVKPGQSSTRRMLCTKSLSLLDSVNGRVSLNYFPPEGPPKPYLGPDHLAVAWDILMQNYRNINMSAKQKSNFMNS